MYRSREISFSLEMTIKSSSQELFRSQLWPGFYTLITCDIVTALHRSCGFNSNGQVRG